MNEKDLMIRAITRNVRLEDTLGLRAIHRQMGYADYEYFYDKVMEIVDSENTLLFISEYNGRLRSYFVVHFLTDLTATIGIVSFYSLANKSGIQRIPRSLESYVLRLGRRRNCDKMEIIIQSPSFPIVYRPRKNGVDRKMYVRWCE
jgi:hypothetical protein